MAKSADHFHVECPQCRASVKARLEQVAKQITCPDCLEDFVVSRPANQEPASRISTGEGDPWDPAGSNSSPDPFGSELFSESASPEEPEPGIWDSQWEETREQLDAILRPDMNNPPASSAPPAASGGGLPKPRGNDKSQRPHRPAANEPYDFTVPCPLCGTRLESTSEKIGTRMRCPDCHSAFEVREPAMSKRRVRGETTSRPEDELRLSDAGPGPMTSPPVTGLPREAFPLPPAPTKSRPTITPVDAIRDTLSRAKKELEEEEKQRPALPARPLTSGVFRFLFEPRAMGRWVILSFFWQVEVTAIQGSISSTDGGGLSQILSVVLRMFAVVVGSLLMGQTAASCLVIAEESAVGRDVIEGWPGMNVSEWFFDSWTLFASLFLSLAPAVLLGQIAYSSGGGFSAFLLLLLVIGGPMLVFVFPILLLSFLENNLPYSPVVWRSLSDAARYWIPFWLLSAVLVAAGGVLAWIALMTSSYVLGFLAVAGGMLLVMVYFRLFGRFSWACEDLLSEREQLQGAEMTEGRR